MILKREPNLLETIHTLSASGRLPRRLNGGVFLGLNGLVIKSHGGTDAMGFASAIDLGYDIARADILTRIGNDLKSFDRSSLSSLAS